MSSRRNFLHTLAAALPAAGAVLTLNGSLSGQQQAAAEPGPLRIPHAGRHHFTGDYGVQLYSLRTLLAKDVPDSLALIKQIGYTTVEAAGFYGVPVPEFRRNLRQAGLQCPGMHGGPVERFQNHFDQILAEARALEVRYVLCSWVDWSGYHTHDDVKRLAAAFNQFGKKFSQAGLHFGFHNHDGEFRMVAGRPLFDTLVENTDPALVQFEMDVFWVRHGGQDPVAYMRKYPKRFSMLHLKDMRPGTPIGVGTTATDEDTVPLGRGNLDIAAILREARAIGIQRYFVEDESAEAPIGILTSLRYLKGVMF